MGILTITFDDGYKDTFEHCAGFLHENDIKATFAVPSSCIGGTLENRPVVEKTDILSLQKMEHEVASHTAHHVNLLDLFQKKGENAVSDEMSLSKIELEKILGQGQVKSFVFPFIEANNTPELRKMASFLVGFKVVIFIRQAINMHLTFFFG